MSIPPKSELYPDSIHVREGETEVLPYDRVKMNMMPHFNMIPHIKQSKSTMVLGNGDRVTTTMKENNRGGQHTSKAYQGCTVNFHSRKFDLLSLLECHAELLHKLSDRQADQAETRHAGVQHFGWRVVLPYGL